MESRSTSGLARSITLDPLPPRLVNSLVIPKRFGMGSDQIDWHGLPLSNTYLSILCLKSNCKHDKKIKLQTQHPSTEKNYLYMVCNVGANSLISPCKLTASRRRKKWSAACSVPTAEHPTRSNPWNIWYMDLFLQEKVHFSSLNYPQSLVFLSELKNRVNHLKASRPLVGFQ